MQSPDNLFLLISYFHRTPRLFPSSTCPFPQRDTPVSTNRNARFLLWERAFPLMGTDVSTCGNGRVSLWKRACLE